jgi:hypothetical protein
MLSSFPPSFFRSGREAAKQSEIPCGNGDLMQAGRAIEGGLAPRSAGRMASRDSVDLRKAVELEHGDVPR